MAALKQMFVNILQFALISKMAFYDDSDSDIEILEVLNEFHTYVTRPYVVRSRENHFDKWDNNEFLRRFRLSKSTAVLILEEIKNNIGHPTNRNHALSTCDQLLLTLRYFATGCMQITAGDFSGVHQTTAGKTIKRVTAAIASKRCQYIKLHFSQEALKKIQYGFYRIARFPLVYGALDCTHVRIQSPGGQNAEHFRNRKGYFSVNTQALCTSDLKFSDIVPRWPGASHDSTIFQNSRLCSLFESGQMGQQVLLGDAGYALKSYLLTPLQNPITEAEKLYNESHIRTRNCIERTFGIWKRRFPVLSLGIRVKVELAQDIIIATAILHNLCVNNGDELPYVDVAIENMIDLSGNSSNELNNHNSNFKRQSIIQNYFSSLQ